MKRRDFIKLGIQSVSLLSIWPASALTAQAALQQLDPVFIVFIDTLIPEDITASASQLGLDKQLRDHATTIENYPKLIELGCQWLDYQARISFKRSFVSLTEPQRIRTVVMAEQATANTIEKMFFERVKADLFRLYYSHPVAWSGMAFDHPPQPVGYPDYVEQPA